MIDVEFTTVTNGDISLEVAVRGAGPLIVFVHGWPELWYSWRHQIEHVTARGYRAAALNVRGYGQSSSPAGVERYTLRELAGDVVAVIDALGDESAVVIGHDWGAPTAWNTARLHPDRVRAVVGMGVPYSPVKETSIIEVFEQIYADRFYYQLYFQEPSVAEAELEVDVARSLRMIYHGASGDADGTFLVGRKPADATLLEGEHDPGGPPSFMTAEDFAVYVESFESHGWTGPINRYRAAGLDSADLGHLPGGELEQPAAFVAGELDQIRRFIPGIDMYEYAGNSCLDFRGSTIVPGVGHWVQQEAPAATNAALDAFLDGL